MPSLLEIIGVILTAFSFAIGIYQLTRPKPHPKAGGVFLIGFGMLVCAATAWWFWSQPTTPSKESSATVDPIKADQASKPDEDRQVDEARKAEESRKAEASKTIEHLRAQDNLRPLADLEEQLPLNRLPNGVYGFCWPDYLPDPVESKLSQKPHTKADLEIHKLRNGSVLVLGFVAQETALHVETGTASGTILIFPEPWEQASSLVSIPLRWITSCNSRDFRKGKVIDLTVRPR